MKQNVMRMDIRAAILQQIKLVIKANDQVAFNGYVATVVESINQMPGSDQNSINYMTENFYRNLAEECKRQGKAEMAVDISARAVEARANLGQDSVLEAGTMLSFAELQPEVRLKALRKMLVERPVVKFEQFSFASNPQSSNIPAFFRMTPTNEKLKQFAPYEGANAISLLDLLLNQPESEVAFQALVKELFANSSENADVKRFLAIWLNFRSEMRGKPVDVELAKLAKFESAKENARRWRQLCEKYSKAQVI